MTDYSFWIYAMLAFGGLITAAVIFTLSKPSDLPYLQVEGCLTNSDFSPLPGRGFFMP